MTKGPFFSTYLTGMMYRSKYLVNRQEIYLATSYSGNKIIRRVLGYVEKITPQVELFVAHQGTARQCICDMMRASLDACRPIQELCHSFFPQQSLASPTWMRKDWAAHAKFSSADQLEIGPWDFKITPSNQSKMHISKVWPIRPFRDKRKHRLTI